MPFTFTPGDLPGILIVTPRIFSDDRGFFLESYRRSELAEAGIEQPFVQENFSKSAQGVLRGLHYQLEPAAQGKLVSAITGSVFDVAVDLRRASPSFGRWTGLILSEADRRMLWIPRGFAHGFLALSDPAVVLYRLSGAEYAPDLERGIIWNDPDLGIDWPVSEPILSPKDARHPPLATAEFNFPFPEATK